MQPASRSRRPSTPHCFFADSDDRGNSILVLDDLESQGARFVEPTTSVSAGVVARGLEYMARYHAATWMNPELAAVDWLRSDGPYRALRAENQLAWLWNEEHWHDYSRRPRFSALSPRLRNRELLRDASRALLCDWCNREPRVLCHGDAHIGQLYLLPDGEARLLDWQSAQFSHWAHDVSYFIVTSLSVDDRRRHERDLLAGYLANLQGFGVAQSPGFDTAFDSYRACALHGIGWVMCLVEMQPEESCVAITERISAAIIDLGTIGRLLG